jgi:hypothetical protein
MQLDIGTDNPQSSHIAYIQFGIQIALASNFLLLNTLQME